MILKKTALFSLLFLTGAAQARTFDIELLIFKRNGDSAQSSERWPQQTQLPDILSSDEIILKTAELCEQPAKCREQLPEQPVTPQAIGASVQGRNMLTPGQLHLSYIRKKLSQHSEYTPLLHIGWRESVRSPQNATFVHLFGGHNYAYQFNSDGALLQNAPLTVSSSSDTIPLNDPMAQQALWELDGKLQVSLNHYLYVDFDMLFRDIAQRPIQLAAPLLATESPESDSQQQVLIGDNSISNTAAFSSDNSELENFLQSYTFKQKRRLKSGELHYFDHPLGGMLLEIRKLEAKTSQVDQ